MPYFFFFFLVFYGFSVQLSVKTNIIEQNYHHYNLSVLLYDIYPSVVVICNMTYSS